MEIKKTAKKWIEKIGITKCIVIILAGVSLIALSVPSESWGSKKNDTEASETEGKEKLALEAMNVYAKEKERETEEILEKAEGVGKVKVMITLAGSEKKVALEDTDTTDNETKETDKAGGLREIENIQAKRETVIIQKDGESTPYVVQICPPEVEGVLVVAQGAGTGKVQAEIIEALQALFSLEAHKIRVMKMK